MTNRQRLFKLDSEIVGRFTGDFTPVQIQVNSIIITSSLYLQLIRGNILSLGYASKGAFASTSTLS